MLATQWSRNSSTTRERWRRLRCSAREPVQECLAWQRVNRMKREREIAEERVVAWVPRDVHVVAAGVERASQHVCARDVRERHGLGYEENAGALRRHLTYLLSLARSGPCSRPKIWSTEGPRGPSRSMDL